MNLVLKSNAEMEAGTQMYARAWAAEPANENFGVHVFNGHIREHDFTKQQQVDYGLLLGYWWVIVVGRLLVSFISCINRTITTCGLWQA